MTYLKDFDFSYDNIVLYEFPRTIDGNIRVHEANDKFIHASINAIGNGYNCFFNKYYEDSSDNYWAILVLNSWDIGCVLSNSFTWNVGNLKKHSKNCGQIDMEALACGIQALIDEGVLKFKK